VHIVCMCVCMYAYMYVCLCVNACMYVCMLANSSNTRSNYDAKIEDNVHMTTEIVHGLWRSDHVFIEARASDYAGANSHVNV
jgi:hypothetical protein